MKAENQRVIDYLRQHLTLPERQNYRFRNVGPNSMMYEDDVDKIFVYISKSNLVIINDGPNVVNGIEMIPIIGIYDEQEMNSYYLQPILHKF